MVTFTLEDYWKYTLNFPKSFEEQSVRYNLKSEEETTKPVEKIIKEILKDKKEFINFIKKYMEDEQLERLIKEEIKFYDEEFTDSTFTELESSIIYEIPNKNIYILVTPQRKIDYQMAEKVANYCIELIQSVKMNIKDEQSPIICPIVLYTGGKKWNAPLTIKSKEDYPKIFPKLEYPTYNLIDINNYSKRELLAEKSTISKILLIERIKAEKTKKKPVNRNLNQRANKKSKNFNLNSKNQKNP